MDKVDGQKNQNTTERFFFICFFFFTIFTFPIHSAQCTSIHFCYINLRTENAMCVFKNIRNKISTMKLHTKCNKFAIDYVKCSGVKCIFDKIRMNLLAQYRVLWYYKKFFAWSWVYSQQWFLYDICVLYTCKDP